MDRRVILSLFTAAVLLTFLSSIPSAQAGYNACGVDFRNGVTGSGGVEICDVGYPCGVSDGICPQNYTQGQNETLKDFYTQPIVTYADPGVKHNISTVDEDNVIAFPSGNDACQRLGGTCDQMLQSSSKQSGYSVSGATCGDTASGLDADKYFRADCVGVPEVAGCENCPDPDCMTRVKGFASNNASQALSNVTVQLTNINNAVQHQAKTNGSGTFGVDATPGYFNVTCGKTLFQEQRFQTYIQPDTDAVSCPNLAAAACSTNCTAPDAFGQDVCVADCNGKNGCTMNSTYQDLCDGLPPDTERVIQRVNDTHVEVANCCSGPSEYRFAPRADVQANSSDIEQFEVTDYQREINGTPVTVKVIRYTD